MTYIQSRRAVAPVIATLLLVAIAVVGGSIVFSISQDFFSAAQISTIPQIDALVISGYDARDNSHLQLHDGLLTDEASSLTIFDGLANNGLVAGERIAIYVTNKGTSPALLNEVRFAGSVFTYVTGESLESYEANSLQEAKEFVIVTKGTSNGIAEISTSHSPVIEPGQQATILLELEQNLKLGRDAQIKLTTANGAVFVGTVIVGQQRG